MNSLVLTLHLAAALHAGPAENSQQDNSWSAWRGCWQADGAPAGEIVCIAHADGGVRIATLIDGAVRDESRIIADGFARPIRNEGCTGTERAHWSSDGRRVFLDSDLRCGSAARRVRGMFAFVAPDEWMSVQTATEGDSVATRVVRFLAVEPNGLPAAAASFATRRTFSEALLAIDEEDVAEAVERIGSPAVQEWMRASGEPFQLGYNAQSASTSSALAQVGRMSNPVVVREVVHVVERPVYVHHTYVTDRHHWHYYSPWGHHHHGWHWTHRPLVVVRFPLIIHRNHNYRRDYYSRRDRDGWRGDRDDDWRGGRATRSGYTSGRDRATPQRSVPDRVAPGVVTDRSARERATPNRATPARVAPGVSTRERDTPRSAVTRTSSTRPPTARGASSPARERAAPQRSSGTSRGVVTRTAKTRSSKARD
jgi:hypothetical protein